MTKRTPGPLKVFTTPDGLKIVGIGTLEGEGVCDAGFGIWRWNDEVGIANAEFIVRAWNAHDDMLAALKEVDALAVAHKKGGLAKAQKIARAAIANANAEP